MALTMTIAGPPVSDSRRQIDSPSSPGSMTSSTIRSMGAAASASSMLAASLAAWSW